MSRLVIHWSNELQRWGVYRTGEFGRYVTSFPTLHEAECWVIAEQERREAEPGVTP